MKYDYTRQEMEDCLRKLGIVPGDNLFLHTNIGFFGRMKNVTSSEELCKEVFEALKSVVTDSGTIVLPAFSYSFFRDEVFNPSTTRSDCGILSEYALKQDDTRRSLDPNFSVVAWGRLAEEFTNNWAHESFGPDSFWSRILAREGKLVCMNHSGSTFVHYVEKSNSVPYRYNKAFNGIIELNDGTKWKDYAVHFVFEGSADYPFFDRLDKKCRETGILTSENLGRGTISEMSFKDYYELISNCIREYPRFLTAGG